MERQKLLVGICDDRKEDIERIVEALRNSLKRVGHPVEFLCRRFLDGETLYRAVGKETFQLLFLDIEMPGIDGFALAGKLGLRRPETFLIFVSVHESLVFDSLEYMPLWFVRKSRLERDMFRAVQKYFQLTASTRVCYRLKEGFGYREIPIREIVYIEGNGHTLTIQRANGSSVGKYGSLKSMETELSEYHFLRIHKNYLVNQEYIEDVGRREVILKDGSSLEMGRDRRPTIQEAMDRYTKEKDGS